MNKDKIILVASLVILAVIWATREAVQGYAGNILLPSDYDTVYLIASAVLGALAIFEGYNLVEDRTLRKKTVPAPTFEDSKVIEAQQRLEELTQPEQPLPPEAEQQQPVQPPAKVGKDELIEESQKKILNAIVDRTCEDIRAGKPAQYLPTLKGLLEGVKLSIEIKQPTPQQPKPDDNDLDLQIPPVNEIERPGE